MKLSLKEIRQIVSGKPLTLLPDDAPRVTAICTNSREMEAESLFIAIRGESFDGHSFVPEAAKAGAIVAIVETPPPALVPGLALIQVANTRVAMGKLARAHRHTLRGKVIAVAGSNGKTSTKHLIDAAMRGKLIGSISPKSFNNDIGVPLTIFAADPAQDYLVLEMGTNHPGEIKVLSDMAQPDIAVITNCGAEHLEGLGDLAGVRRENAQVTSGLNPKGLLIINGDDPALLTALTHYAGRRLTFGFKDTNDLFATDVVCTSKGTTFSLNGRCQRVTIPMLGRHSACNALAAIAVARSMRLEEEAIIESLATSEGPEMRLQLQPAGDITLLNDAYNANPHSMRAAIETLAALETAGRRVAVLGDMLELGASSESYHREIGGFATSAGKLDLLICVGPRATLIADAAIAAGFPADAVWRFPDATAAAVGVPNVLRPGDMVLLKASRGIRLETVAAAVKGSTKDGR